MTTSSLSCPCQSGKLYIDCCEPFHFRQAFPDSAEKLMRSRYAAYVLLNIPYIVETTLPNQQQWLDQAVMKEWGETTDWVSLTIIEHRPFVSKRHSLVEFKAFFNTKNGVEAHHERSLFVQFNQRWYFVDPTVPLPNLKQPCICGSGQKFKHCCAMWL